MDELTPDEQALWNEVIKGTTKLILAMMAFLVMGVVVVAAAANGQPLWCFAAVMVFIALGKKIFDSYRAAGFSD